MDAVINLIGQSFTTNDYGVPVPKETKTQVFAKVQSVSRTEFFSGGRNGLNPEFRFDIFAGDYNGETIVEYNGNRYGVYRTYKPDPEYYNGFHSPHNIGCDYIELYVERKGGTNGAASESGQSDTGN